MNSSAWLRGLTCASRAACSSTNSADSPSIHFLTLSKMLNFFSLVSPVRSVEIDIFSIYPPAVRRQRDVAISALFQHIHLIPIILRFYNSNSGILRHHSYRIVVGVGRRPEVDIRIRMSGLFGERIEDLREDATSPQIARRPVQGRRE